MASFTKYFYGNGEYLNYSTSNVNEAIYSLTFTWEITNQNVVSNTSTISWSLKASAEAGFNKSNVNSGVIGFGEPSYIRFGTDDVNASSTPYDDIAITLAGTKIYNKTNLVKDLYKDQKDLLLDSGTFTVTHDTNGNYSADISCAARIKNIYDTTGKAGYTPYGDTDIGSKNAATVSGTLTLNSIPRYAVLLSAPSEFTDEDSPRITFAIPSGATNVRAYIAFNTSTVDIGSYAISGSSYTFNFTEAEKRKLWSILDQGLNTKQVYFYVRSEFNGTLYHSEPIISTLKVINYTPIINSNVNEIYDTNEDAIRLTGDKYKLIRYVSNAYYNIGAEGRKGATISSVSIKNGNLTKYSSTGTFEGVTSPIFEYTATDSRGNSIPLTTTNVDTIAGYWIPYVKLTCSATSTEMTADGDIKVTLSGKYFNGNFSASKRNRLRMHYETIKDGDDLGMTDMGYIDLSDSRGSFSYNSTTSEFTYTFTISNLNYMSVYEFTIRVSDEVAVQGTETQLILASEPIFDWGRTDFNFNVPVNINGNLTLTGNITAGGNTVPTIVAQGTAGIWTYRTWSDGTAECWGKKDVSVTFPSTANWGGLYTTGAIPGSNVNFPFGLFAETPVVNASLLIRSSGGILMAPGGAGSNIASMDQTGVYEIARGAAVSGAQAYTINYQVIGRWK